LNRFYIRHCLSPTSGNPSKTERFDRPRRVTPAIETRFVRLFYPATILTAATVTFKRSADNRLIRSSPRLSTGSAINRIFIAAPRDPSIASRPARGTNLHRMLGFRPRLRKQLILKGEK
jgi:hypothetical protein